MSQKLLHVKITKEQYDELLNQARAYLTDELDAEISYFQAKRIVDFFRHKLGPTVYNQAVQDAHQFVQRQLMDLESTLYEPEVLYKP